MILSLSGVPGSGKTSVGRILASRLGYAFYSMGDLRGKMATERGITVDELNRIGETDKTTDTTVDDYQRELGKKEDDFVIEGRLSWHFIPSSFKVFLTCNLHESAKRIFEARKLASGERSDEPMYKTVEDAEAAIQARTASDVRRYQAFYSVNHLDTSHYDLVVDTTGMKGPEETAETILKALRDKGLAPKA